MIPTIIIAGTHSGCGKTTISGALMAALVNRGMVVQPFKIGPDFIDPSHHSAICKRNSRNLDPYMMGETGVLETFKNACRGADIAVIEGVMGMYDGLEGCDIGSTAHVSKILNAPVILVIDAKGSSRSVNAVALGFKNFDPEVNLAGVILNRLGSSRHFEMIKPSLKIPVYGCILNSREKSVKSRHLGLEMAHETSAMSEFADILEENADIDGLIQIAKISAEKHKEDFFAEEKSDNKGKTVRIGVAFDEAFNFYYQDNFDRLRKYGADLIFFSPMEDALPKTDALYFGGGYPELHLKKLESSKCREEIKKAADSGMVIYAECGGLTYLCENLESDGNKGRMCGIIPADALKMNRFQALGYVTAKCCTDKSILPKNICYNGHEFHYTKLNCGNDIRFALKLSRGIGVDSGRDGVYVNDVLAGYTHAYFSEKFAENFVSKALLEK
ncbi:MAG: cobyrinate a,c-diamide synthase [Methanomicrobium sp.]|nr:cobyrinate a,c-diamide synthase [Methanomicrobium sp.]MDD4299206.1 cobyrinate a,c-diamide synthase [Methanomicrobium sp.]